MKENINENIRKVVDLKGLSEYLGIGTSTIRKLIYNNNIPYFKINSKYEFHLDIINKWIISKHNDINLGDYDNDIN